MPNRLSDQSSPYLLQHANNPVDWYPWGPEALERSRNEDKPILLSVGYSACHWCHVMEHESFENEGTAKLMNELFVNIKVDREERPDLDSIYMQAVQAMTGHGGWPMTVFLTPAGEPFYGGTYYPPDDRQGMPSFVRVLRAVSDAYTNRRDDVGKTAAQLRQIYDVVADTTRPTGALTRTTFEGAYRALAQSYDHEHAGFGGAPKFPPSMSLEFLLTYQARTGESYAGEMVAQTFRAMSRGGMYDQIGGGFHRYSVDAQWLVPHFEKMLYDNALLARLGVHLWQVTKDPEVRRVTEQTLDWVVREMISSSGGFFSSLDADSEGHEGKFYVWSDAELRTVAGDDAALTAAYWGVTPHGNFEGTNIPNVPVEPAIVARRAGASVTELNAAVDRARQALYDVRARRVWPGLDDKVLAGWNALMLRAFAEAARAFGRDDYRDVALRNAEFLRREMIQSGRVRRSHKDGVTRGAGFLEDHAAMGLAFLDLYALTFDRRWFDQARELADAINRWFWDDERQAFFDTASDHETLITRPRDVTDNAVPAGTSLAADLLLRLGELTGDSGYVSRGRLVVETLAEPLGRYPMAFGHLLGAADIVVNGATQVALVGDPSSMELIALGGAVGRAFAPSLVIAGGGPTTGSSDIALLVERPLVDGRATAYVCRHYTCQAPVTSAEELQRQLGHSGTLGQAT